NNHWVLIGLCLLSSYLLIADIRLLALKFKSFGFKGNEMRYILIAISLGLLIALQYAAVPLIIIVYIVLSLIDNRRNND
ncbi:MAG: phosphatidylserine synthase, partial [Bacteroidota bacterium]